MASGWEIASSIATSFAAAFAAVQIWLTRTESQRKSTLEHLREIDARLQVLWGQDTAQLQQDVLSYYRDPTTEPTSGVAQYLAFLNTLDLLGLAYEAGTVDKKLVHAHIDTLIRTHVLSLSFVKELQKCCGDDHVYEHLERLFHRQLADRSNRSPPLPRN